MTNEKVMAVLTDEEKRAVREMLQHVMTIENWKWNGKPLMLGALISLGGFLSLFFWGLINMVEKGQLDKRSEAEPSSLMIIAALLAIVVMVNIASSAIVGLLFYFFFKQWRDRSIAELHRIQQQVPGARSAIEKLKIFCNFAKDFREFYLAHCEHTHPSRALQKLITNA